jgi:hypothetical protein
MQSVLHQHTAMAIKMASGGGALFPTINFCLYINIAKGPCSGPLKLNTSQITILSYVYSWFVSYWPPPTIVTNGQTQFRHCRESYLFNFRDVILHTII